VGLGLGTDLRVATVGPARASVSRLATEGRRKNSSERDAYLIGKDPGIGRLVESSKSEFDRSR